MSTDDPDPLEIEQALLDFGFYHDLPSVKRMYAEYVNNNLLGYAGGVNEQPEEYWSDMATMRWLQLWVKHVKPIPQLEKQDVISRLKKGGTLNGGVKHDK